MIKPLPSDPRYLVSDDGDVYRNGRKLKPWIQNGYYKLNIGGRNRYVHLLVLETHIGPRPPGAITRHGQRGPLVNSLDNIRYGTYSENEYDKVRDGTHQNARKTHCAKAGHPLSGENLYIMPGSGRRQCRQCRRDNQNRRRAERRGLVSA